MIAKREVRTYDTAAKVWAGKYLNSQNVLHWHPDCELSYVERGSIDVFCDKRWHTLTQGDAILIDGGQVHYLQARSPDTVLIVVFFDPSIVRSALGEEKLVSPKLSASYRIPDYYKRTMQLFREKKKYFATEIETATLLLALNIFRNEETFVEPPRPNDPARHTLTDLLEVLDEKFENFTFDDAAGFMGLNPSYFSRYFHERTGMSFTDYLNVVRTENAIRLLQEENELSITEVAERCGFGTIRSFNRTFKKLTGYTPKELPRDFVLNHVPLSSEEFDPTRFDCKLIESVDSI